MNKIYNVVWSHATQSWVVVSELAKAHKKKSSHSSTQSFVDAISQTFKLSLVAALLGSSLSANAATTLNGGQTTGGGTTAVGAGSEANVEGATAIGENTYANGVAALAIGGASRREWAAQATARYTVAVGEKSRATHEFAVAMGNNAKSENNNAISVGVNAHSKGLSSTAMGANAKAGVVSTDVYDEATKTTKTVNLTAEQSAVAIGNDSSAETAAAVAVGTKAITFGSFAVAIGTDAHAGKKGLDANAGQIAVGVATRAYGAYATAIGHATEVNADFGSAFGKRANAKGVASTALGVYAEAEGHGSVAIGGPSYDNTIDNNASVDDAGKAKKAARTTGEGAVAVGASSLAHTRAVAVGIQSNANGERSIAVGHKSEAATESVSMGFNAKTQGSGNIAIGKNAGVDASKGTGDADAVESNLVTNSVAIGTGATATSKNSIVIGNGAKSIRADKSYKTGANAIAIGEGADASYTDSIAMGTSAAVGMTESVAIGNGAKGNVKANGNGKASTAVGARTEAEGDNATAVGVLTYATATNASAFGVSAKAQGGNSVAIGHNAQALSGGDQYDLNGTKYSNNALSSVVIGDSALTRQNRTVTLGYKSQTLFTSAVAIGDAAYADAARSISIGRSSRSTGENAVALGSGDQNGNSPTTASGAHSIAVGSNARAEQSSTIAMGKDAQATIEQGVALGSSSVTTGLRNAQAFDPANGRRNYFEEARNTGRAARSTMAGVSVGSSTQSRQINNVAGGTVDTDAVNVAQLKAVNLKVEGNTTDSAGADVRLVSNTLKVQGTNNSFITTNAVDNQINISTTQARTTVDGNGVASVNSSNNNPTNALVTAADIINTINKAGWNIQTSGSNLGTGNQTGKAKVSAGTDVSFQAANNLTAKRTGTTIEYGLASDLTNINSIQGAGNKVSLTAQGVDVGGQNITNLKSGGTTVNNAANIGDVQNISKTNELHIKPNTYAVGTDGSVSLAYENGNEQPVANKTTKITGIARADDLWSLQVDKNGTKTDVNAQNKKVALKQGKNVTLDAAAGQITINADDQVEKVEKDGGDSNADNLITVTSTNAGKANATYKLNVSKSVVRSAAAWNLKDGKDTGNGHAIAGGESAVFKNADNDNNILVSRNLNAITVGLSKALTGMTSIGGNGSTITFTNAGLDVGNKNITNLASGGNVVTNAANIGDVNRIVGANQWGLQIDNGSRTDVPPVNSKVALKQGNDISLVKTKEGEITINSTAKLHTQGNSVGVGLVSLSDQSLTVKGADKSFIHTIAGNQEITIETKQGSIIPDSSQFVGIPSLGVDGLVTASTVVNAIQKSGWIAIGAGNVNLNSDGTPGLAYRNLIKPGDTVTFEAGKNLTVVQPSTDPAKFTFALNSKLEGITQVGGNGTTITFNQGGIGLGGDNAPKKITGVANGTDEHDAVNFGQLQNIIAANGSTETVKKDVNVANNLAAVRVSKGSEGAPNAEYSVSVKTEDVKDAARQAVTLTQNSTGPIKVTATPNETTHNTNYSVTFDGAEAAKSIPLSYAANNETAKTVTLEQGLKFTNGTRTVASVENGGVVKFDLNQATADKIDNAITNNTIALGDGTDFTKAQNLTEENGIRFNVVGANNSENIVTKASLGGNNISVDLSSAMKQTINNKANNTLNNITPEGEKVITGLGTEITAGDRISLDGSTTDANGKRHYRISADKQVEAVEAAEHKANDENLVEVTVTSGKKGEANATYAVGVSKQAVQNAAAWILKDGNDTASSGKTISGGQAVVIKNADANVAVKRTDNEISVGLANTLTNINAIGGNNQTIKFENEGINVGGAQITNVKSGGDGPNNAANISDVTRISQANDTFIKKDTYAVNGDNEVVLKYANAAGEVAGEAKITGVAKASDIWSLQANGADVTPNNKKVNLVQGDNISITSKDGTVTISSKFNAADAAKNDLRLVQNQAEGSNGKYAVSDAGEVTLTVQDGNGGNKSNVVIGGIAKNDLSNITTTGESKVKNLAAWKIQANDAVEQTVAGGDTVKFKNGQNIEITNENKVFTVKTADNLTASSLTTGNTAVTNSGVTVTNTADPSKSVHLTVSGLNNGGNKITNVERGTESSDAVNKGQLDEIGDNVISLGADGNTATQTQTLRQAGGIKFNVLGGSNITTAGAGNNVTVTLANALTGITSIAGNGTTVSWTGEGLNLGDGSKQIKGIAKGTQDNDAVNVAQLNAVSTQLNNTVKLGGNTGVTKEQTLSQAGGIQFNVVGAENGKNIVTNATGTDGNVTVDLSDEMKTTINNKANTNLDNITTDGKKVITGLGTVLEAGDRITLDDSKSDKETGKKVYKVSAAEQVEKVVKKAGDDNILEYEAPNAGQANATYTLGVSKAKVADIAKEASAWNLQVNAGNAEKVEGGDTVKFVNGTNIAVTNTGKEITIGTNPNLTATSLETGDTRVETGGITIKNGANGNATVSLTKVGLNNGGNKITNVERGTESSDAVNKGQLDEIGDNVISLGADGNTATQTQTLRQAGGIKFNVLGGSNITTAGAGNNVTVTLANALTGITSIAGNGTTVSWTGEGLNLGDGSKQIKGIAKGTQDNDAVNVAQLNAVSTQLNNTVKLGGNTGVTKEQTLSQAGGIQFNVVGAENGKNIVTNATGTDGNVTVDLSDEMKTTINNKANTNLDNITTDGKKVITGLGTVLEAGDRITLDDSKSDKETGKKVYKVSAAEQVEKVVKKAGDDNILEYEAPNAGQANATYTLGVSKAKVADIAKEASAWNLQVNAGNAEKVEGGDTVKFVNGTNIAVTNTGKEITIGTNPNLTATSLETGDTRVETGGITIKNGANGNATVSLTKAGLNNGGNQITNVAEGTETNHAVNVGQLNKVAAKATTTVSVNDGNTDGNLVLTTNNKFEDGHTNYDVKLANKVTLGTENNKKVIIDGTVGRVLVGAGDTGSPINIDGVAHQITGLTNTTLDVAGFGQSTRAATEEQLQKVREEAAGNDLHITSGATFNVGAKDVNANAAADEVTLTYSNANGVVQGKTTVIKGVANTDLSNITDGAKTTIQSLTNVVGDGKNISVASEVKDGVKTYTVKGADQVESVTTSTAAQDDENIATVTMVEGTDKSANARYGVGVSKAKVSEIAKESVKVVDGQNAKVTATVDGKATAYKVDVEGALAKITSITNEAGTGKVSFDSDQVVKVNGDKSISLDGKGGFITGLQNTAWDIANQTIVSGRAATEDQLKVVSNKTHALATNTIRLGGDNKSETAEQTLDKEGGIKFEVKGSKNITTKAEGTSVAIDLSDEAKATLAHKYSVEGVGNNVHVDTDTTDKANTKFKVSVDKTKLEAGVNTTVTGDGITNAFQVNVAGNLSGITSITNNTGSGKVSFAENGVVSVEGDKSISLDGKTGVITGLTNTTLDVAGFGQSTRAATEEQLKALSDKAKTTVSVNNEGKDENKNLALTETTREDGHTNYDIKLADKVTLGKDNNKVVVNGENGSIVVGGNAEKAVTINGTEGTVTNLSNRTWEIGKTEAVKGRAATEDQLKALDTVINGGLNFATQTANVVINRKLGDTLEIVGGNAEAEVKAEDYTGANIRTFSENNKVVIRMAKNVNLTDKGSVNVGNTVVNNDGVEIKRPAGDKAEATVVTLTGNGLNNGGNTITNVKAGEKDTDVVNVSQLNAKAAAAKTTVSVNGEDKDANKNLVLTESKATDGHTNYDVKLANKVTLGTDTTKQVILDGTAGSITAGSGNNVVIVDGSKALIRVGNGTNHVSIDGASGHITGLANREWVVGETTAVSGRAATEDQLKSVSDKVNVVASNTIKLSGDKGSVTDVQRLDQKNGINFSVVGDNKYIETKAEGSKVAVGLTEDIKGKIDNAANNNLTNITNEGKKEITKLGTIVEGSDSVSVSVSKEDKDTGQKTYKVDLKPVVAIGDSHKVTINGTTGNVGGLTNKTWNPDQITSGQAATEDQLKVVHNEVKDVMNKGLTFKAQDNSSVTKKLGDTLDVVGENGITTVVSTDNKLVVKLGNNLNIGEKAKDGKEGVDGSIGVNGKDGSAVVINGKDGSIGLNGKDGKNGVTIKGADGKVGVDGKDGTTRIVYTENNKTHEVATTEDGMKFGGDKGTTVSRKLNSQLNVKGGAKGELTENNIAVVADGNDTLNVKLAKDVDLGDKGSVKIGKTVINENGVTIGLDKKTAVKLTEEGLNNGGRRVTNIAEGKENTDAVSVSQLRRTNQAVINNAHNIARLDNKIDNVDRNLRAGIAGALATGGLYQAAQPGKSMISAGAGTYKGQNAVAVGYSRISDNGKIGVKFSVNSNTRGDKGAAASVGYQW